MREHTHDPALLRLLRRRTGKQRTGKQCEKRKENKYLGQLPTRVSQSPRKAVHVVGTRVVNAASACVHMCVYVCVCVCVCVYILCACVCLCVHGKTRTHYFCSESLVAPPSCLVADSECTPQPSAGKYVIAVDKHFPVFP